MSFKNFISARGELSFSFNSLSKLLLLLLCFPFWTLQAQKADLTLIDYKPAPGQYVNVPGLGTPQGAKEAVEDKSGLVTLGSFGGEITFKLNEPILNDAQHPYGIDFTIFGNAFDGSSEPGIVMVQKDENGNGLADGTWYELAGSDHYFKSTIKNYEITYTNPGGNVAKDVPWIDNQGGSGAVAINDFHGQPYYPTASYFPTYPQDQMSFNGTLVGSRTVHEKETGLWKNLHYRFGYCDNTANKIGADLSLPSNPYGEDVSPGSGGDGFDINWAIDAAGNHINLDRIDFIKIYTSSNTIAGILGEVSTEFAHLSAVAPNSSIQAESRCVVINSVPLYAAASDQIDIEALAFNSGIPSGKEIQWTLSNPDIAAFNSEGKLLIKGAGLLTVKAALTEDANIYDEVKVKCEAPGSIQFLNPFVEAFIGDELFLELKAVDKAGNDLPSATFNFVSNQEDIAQVIEIEGKPYFKAIAPGQVSIHITTAALDGVFTDLNVIVLPKLDPIQVYVNIKSPAGYLLYRSPIVVSDLNINPQIKSDELIDFKYFSPAHAIVAAFKDKLDIDHLTFKNDGDGNNQLYISNIQFKKGGALISFNGFGGSQTLGRTKSWVLTQNKQTLVTDFNGPELKANDEITLYYVEANNQTWEADFLQSDKTSGVFNEQYQISAQRVENTLANYLVQTSSSPLEAPIFLNGQAFVVDGQAQRTNAQGEASFTFPQEGIQMIQVGNASIQINTQPEGLSSIEDNAQIRLYPTIVESSFTIEQHLGGVAEMKIIDVNSRCVLQRNLNQGKQQVLCGNLPMGMYFIQIQYKAEQYIQKIIVK